jgi:hypothetical protein
MEGSDDESMEMLAYKIANKILPKDAQTNEIEQEKEHIIQIFNIYNNMITFYEDVDDE